MGKKIKCKIKFKDENGNMKLKLNFAGEEFNNFMANIIKNFNWENINELKKDMIVFDKNKKKNK